MAVEFQHIPANIRVPLFYAEVSNALAGSQSLRMTTEPERQERKIARRLGGKQQPRSGAGPWRKHDVDLGNFLVEAKQTAAGSYRLTVKEWEVLRKRARMEGKLPMYHIEMGGRRLLVVEEDDVT